MGEEPIVAAVRTCVRCPGAPGPKRSVRLMRRVRVIPRRMPAWPGGVLAGVCLLLTACASSPPAGLTVQPDDWTYAPRSVELQLSAAETLNIDSGQAHALSLGVFQLSDPAAFTTLAASAAGAEKLLDQGMDADPTVVGFDRIVLQPGERRTIDLNRAAHAQYLGLVAGYFKITPAQDVVVFNIPIVPKPTGWVTKGMVAAGLQGADTDGVPGPVTLSAGFGSEQVATFAWLTPGSAKLVEIGRA